MATTSEWIHGARPRTLPAAVVPVGVGIACAAFHGIALPGWDATVRSGLAVIVAVALQVGVNFANDYSDGVRGTDDERLGPVRLVGQQLAPAAQVRMAAVVALAIAALAGLLLVVISGMWWLLLVGAVAIAAAWFYTGGPRPYGYSGLGELMVFVFFGLVAVGATTLVLAGQVTVLSVLYGVALGMLAVALLVVNNLRDIPSDLANSKMTLAVRLGDARTRTLFGWCLWIPLAIAAFVGLGGIGFVPIFPAGAIFALVAAPLTFVAWRTVKSGATGSNLVRVLALTATVELVYGLATVAGIVATMSLS